MSNGVLTKVLFKKALECPRKLKYAAQPHVYANNSHMGTADNAFLASLAEAGHQVGEYAKLQFPGGVEIESRSAHEAVRETRALLEGPEDVVVFEGAVAFMDYFVRADIIVKTGKELRLIEVKAKSFDSREHDVIAGKKAPVKAAFMPYIQDVAFQQRVLEGAYPGYSIRASLMMPDKAVRTVVPGLNALFRVVRGGDGYGDDSGDARAGRGRGPLAVHVTDAARTLVETARRKYGENLLVEVAVDEQVWLRHCRRNSRQPISLTPPS
jgi:hypothetical protein